MERDLMEIKSLGLFGIYIESIKIITSATFRKTFLQITLALIVPLTFVLFNHMHIGHLLGDLLVDLLNLYDNLDDPTNIRHRLPSKWALFGSLTVLYFIFLLILSILTTSVVVYTVGSIYASKPITFKKVMGVVPKAWKRLLVNFLWNFLVVVAYIIVLAIIITVWPVTLADNDSTPRFIVLAIALLFYAIGFGYINVVWQSSNVVSVLEETYGLKAMKKSRLLIKGKLLVASFNFVIMLLSSLGLEVVFEVFVVHGVKVSVVHGVKVSVVVSVILGIVCVLLALGLLLLGLVVQTVIYFVCKSYHHEVTDKPSLAEHLESLRGDYVALKEGGEVQLQELYV